MGEVKPNQQNLENDRELLLQRMDEKDFNRLSMAFDSSRDPEELRELTLKMANNQIVRVKREARQFTHSLKNLIDQKSSVDKLLEIEREKAFKDQFEIKRLENLSGDLETKIRSTREALAAIGNLTFSLLDLYATVGSDHDIAQLIGARVKDVDVYRKNYVSLDLDNSLFFIALVFAYQAESDTEHPLYEALFHFYQREIERNDGLKKSLSEKINKLFPRVPKYVLTQDENGKETLQQIYKPLELV